MRLASDRGRDRHHCRCCGERLSTCLDGAGMRFASCPTCGSFTSDGSPIPFSDPLADLLRGSHEADARARMMARARESFGDLVAGYLVPVERSDQRYTYARLSVDAHRLDLRYADHFEAASSHPCDELDRCTTGRLWTRVQSRDELLDVYLHGVGDSTSPCDHPQFGRVEIGHERTSSDHLRL
ncbi:hypothetical protein ACFXKW_26590 [Streptomyces sp. NPDC059193]|uniref:hypothetical protein n=1 Tax=Streptomyces sp. NPDC059193 TaxID=3346763 RepID=UPI00368153CB